MDNEQALNKSVNTNDSEQNNIQSALVDIIHVLRAHLFLIIILTALFAAGGSFYAKSRTPTYTASVPVLYKVEVMDTDVTGKEVVDQVSSTNYEFAYIETAVRVCRSGEVLDRANVYYHYYKESGKKLDDFITELGDVYSGVKADRVEIPGYPVDAELQKTYRNKWFTLSNAGTDYKAASASEAVLNFRLWASDTNRTVSIEKARIYALAADVALNLFVNFGSGTVSVWELNNSSSGVSVGADVPSNRIIIIAAFIGFMISLAFIYILYLLDNTVKAKEQLEKMTGASVIAYIDDVSEAK